MPALYSRTVVFIATEPEIIRDKRFTKFGVMIDYISYNGAYVRFPAFLQPLRYKNKMYLGGARTELGIEEKKMFLLIYPAAVNITKIRHPDTAVVYDGYRYLVDRIESVYVGNEVIYNWAIVHKGVEYDIQNI